MTFDLSSPLLYEIGLEAAVERLTEEMQAKNHFQIKFEADDQVKPLSDDVRVLLFQTIRELLVNIGRHAQARNSVVSMKRHENNLLITVSDDGIGFDASAVNIPTWRQGGFGLFTIRERLDYIGGQTIIESEAGRGTRITLKVPLNEEQTNESGTNELGIEG